jgi:hypothetical protein
VPSAASKNIQQKKKVSFSFDATSLKFGTLKNS